MGHVPITAVEVAAQRLGLEIMWLAEDPARPRSTRSPAGLRRRTDARYSLLDVRVTTPALELHGATDNLLDELADLVRDGKAHADPAP